MSVRNPYERIQTHKHTRSISKMVAKLAADQSVFNLYASKTNAMQMHGVLRIQQLRNYNSDWISSHELWSAQKNSSAAPLPTMVMMKCAMASSHKLTRTTNIEWGACVWCKREPWAPAEISYRFGTPCSFSISRCRHRVSRIRTQFWRNWNVSIEMRHISFHFSAFLFILFAERDSGGFFRFFFCLPFDSHVNYRHERMLTGVRVVPNKCYRFCCYGRSWTVSVSTRRLLLVHRTHTRKRSSGKQGETKEEEEKKQNGGRSAVMRIGWPIFQRITCDSILWTINPSTEFQNHENSNLEKKEDKTKKLKYLPVFRFRWPFQGRVLISKYEYFFLRHHTLDFPSARIEMMPFRVQYSRIYCLFFVSCD